MHGALSLPEDAPSAGEPSLPRPLRLARTLWVGGALLSAARSVVQLADRQDLVAQLRQASPELNQDQVDAAASGAVLVGLLAAAALVVGYLILANRMTQGANWARIVLAVLGAGELLLGGTRLLSVGSGLAAQLGLRVSVTDIVLSAAELLVILGALVLMFAPSVTAYFRRRRAGGAPPAGGGH